MIGQTIRRQFVYNFRDDDVLSGNGRTEVVWTVLAGVCRRLSKYAKTNATTQRNHHNSIKGDVRYLPGSGVSRPGGGCVVRGPGVLPEPGDRTSSFTAPLYDIDELGGLCKIMMII